MGVLREHQDLRKKKRIGAGNEVRTRDLNLGKVAFTVFSISVYYSYAYDTNP